MPRPKRNLLATVEDTFTPPDALTETQAIARVTKAEGKNLYNVELPNGKAALVELEPKFRSTIWMKRGTYVVVDSSTLAERDNKIAGEIVNIVTDERQWRKMSYWPKQFEKKSAYEEDSDEEEESVVGKLPPADSDEE